MIRTMTSLAVLLAAKTALAAAPSPTALVGPAVGPSELYLSQGLKDYNAKHYEQARDELLKALHAKPDNAPAYLTLARTYMRTQQLALACWTYRVYLKAAPQAADAAKATTESAACEKQLAKLKPPPADPGPGFVDQKAAFQEAAEAGKLLGPGSASAVLAQLLKDGYVSPDLADLGAKLRDRSGQLANATYDKAVSHEVTDPAQLREAAQLYRLSQDAGATDATYTPRARFCEAMAAMQEKKWTEAEKAFKDSAGAGADKDARFYGAVAVYHSGDRRRALQIFQKDLPDDPRTSVLELDQAIAQDPAAAADTLEKKLFRERYKQP